MPRKTKEDTKTKEHADCDCELDKKSNAPSKNKKKVGGGAEHVYILTDNRLTTQDNKDNSYNEIGIIHTCESVAINIVRSTATGFLNMFGSSGFDNTIFDKARHDCLISIQGKLDSDKANVYKVSNIRFEAITVDPSLITMNAYGTLLIKSKTVEKEAKKE
jgi:hypothetical protein